MNKEKNRFLKEQMLIAACLNIGHIMVGYSVAWTAPVIPKLQDINQSPLSEVVSLPQASWIGSSYTIGAIVGPFLTAYISNVIGRRPCLMLGGSLTMVGFLMISLARDYAVILAGRATSGFALGILCVLHLVYIGEVASPNVRGIILTSTGVFHTLGSLLMYCTGPFLSYSGTGYLMVFVSAVYLLGCVYIPESPLYYVMKGNEDRAIKILNDLGRGKDIQKELQNLLKDSTSSQSNSWTWRELINIKSNRRSLVITVGTCVFQELCGIIAVIVFTTTIFQEAGSSVEPSVATIIVGTTQFLTTLVAPLFVEKLGRKFLLLISTSGCCVCMATLGLYFYLDYLENSFVTKVRWLPLLSLVLSCASFSFGLSIIPNTLIGEMYRPNVRSIGTSISMTIGWMAGVISITSFGYIVEALGSYTMFFAYTIINGVGFIFILFFVPETKGMTLREIEIMLSK